MLFTVGNSGRAHDELRFYCELTLTQPTQTAQNETDVTTEDACVRVGLVNHDELQTTKKVSEMFPLWERCHMQNVRICDEHPAVVAQPLALLARGIAVENT
tara:strand:+ start:1114 stop:1416 length:303 start_codon:yes stop_codon:yes gene_type:complete